MAKYLIKFQRGGKSFNQTFREARKKGLKTFQYKGKLYGTQLKGEPTTSLEITDDVTPIQFVPQQVYTTTVPVTEIDLEKHPDWAQRTRKAKYDETKMPIIEYLQTEAIKNGQTPGYYIGQNRQGQTVYVNKQDAKNLHTLYNSTKGSKTMDEDMADIYGDILSNTAATVMPTVTVRTTQKKAGEGDKTFAGFIKNPRILVDDNGGTRQITIDPRLKDRVFEDMDTGDYVITSPTHKEILFRTMNPKDLENIDKARDMMYAYHTRQDALDYTAHKQALDELFGNNVVNSHIKNGWNPETGEYDRVQDLAEDVRVGRNRFARGVNAVVNGFNHAIAGLPRIALNDDYTLKDYKQGFLDSPHKSTVGLGDIFEIENPNLRWFTNLVNPMSVGYTTANAYTNSSPGSWKPVQSDKSTMYLPSTGKVNGSVFSRGNKPWQGMGTVAYNTSRGNRPLFNGSRTQYGSTVIPVSGGGKTPVSFRVSGLEYVPGEVNVNPRTWMPIMFKDPNTQYPEWNPDPQGYTETEAPSRDFYIDWAKIGVVDKGDWVAPNKDNTSGGNWIWYDTDNKKIVSAPGVGGPHKKKKTEGTPSVRSHTGT